MSATMAWLEALHRVLTLGTEVAPRGKKTLEVQHSTLEVDMNRPVVFVPERALNFKFMAAEAKWILDGDDSTSIVEFNKNIAQFSDDGERFFGAYGPRIAQQMPHVLRSLSDDPTTRQATITTWRPNPPKSKDIPCTVAMNFSLRDSRLNMHVFMRSSDVWLGVPYDVFSFSMVAYSVIANLNVMGRMAKGVTPGTLYLTAASSHVYEENFSAARSILGNFFHWGLTHMVDENYDKTNAAPPALYETPFGLDQTLAALRASKPGDVFRWWEPQS